MLYGAETLVKQGKIKNIRKSCDLECLDTWLVCYGRIGFLVLK